MNQSRFTLCAFADEAGPRLEEQIKALQENGISFLEIRGVDGKNIADLTPEAVKEIKTRLDAEGIRVWSMGSPCGKIGIRDEFAPHLDQFRRVLESAHILEADRLRMFSFFMNGVDPADCRDQVMERLQRMVEEAEGSGVVLCHENEKGIYGDVADRCVDIHQAIPALKAVYDPANFLQCAQETVSAFEKLSPYIDYCHIKDCCADGRVVPAGEGEGKIQELLKRYEALGGKVLTLEPHLAEFVGLGALENGQKSEVENRYPTHRAAFDAGVEALKGLI